MEKFIRKYSHGAEETYRGKHRFEHWYVDNQVYFITARCREKYPAFAAEPAKAIFWDRLEHYTSAAEFTPWITTLMNNHYHMLGYCRKGQPLGMMMQRIHGSVAKLVNDLLPERRRPFWSEAGHQDYFDGCIRDETQCRRAYLYVLRQSTRHGICIDWEDYPHTKANVALDEGIKRAIKLKAFLEGIPYRRYQQKRKRRKGPLPR